MTDHDRDARQLTLGARSTAVRLPGRRHQAQDCAPELDAPSAEVARADLAQAAEFYERTVPQVFGLLRAMLSDGSAAEDITVQVYRHAWRARIDTSPPAEGALAWLVAQAHRHAAEHLRAHRTAEAQEPQTFTARAPRSSLDNLDGSSRDLFALVYYRGYTYRQAAIQLGLPAATALSRIHAALRAVPKASSDSREPMPLANPQI